MSKRLLALVALLLPALAYGAITAEQKYLLNSKMGAVASKVQLGTLLDAADTVVSADITDGTIVNADVSASAAVAFSKLAALTSANILVGNGSNVATAVDPSGDVDISNAGVFSIGSGVVVDADVSASAAIATSKLAGATHTTEGLQKIEHVAVVTWDFAVDGGAMATTGLGVTLPDNAVVTKVVEDFTSHCTSGASNATIKLVLPTDGDLSANVTCDGTTIAVASVLPTGTPVKLTAARELSVTIGTAAATAGVARWFVYYVQSI